MNLTSVAAIFFVSWLPLCHQKGQVPGDIWPAKSPGHHEGSPDAIHVDSGLLGSEVESHRLSADGWMEGAENLRPVVLGSKNSIWLRIGGTLW